MQNNNGLGVRPDPHYAVIDLTCLRRIMLDTHYRSRMLRLCKDQQTKHSDILWTSLVLEVIFRQFQRKGEEREHVSS